MAQFDVYRNPDSRARRIIPYLLVVQSDLLGDLATCTVVPLVDATQYGKPAKRLNPVFTIEQTPVVMSTAEIASVPRRILRHAAGSLAGQRDAIVAAIDFLIFGF
jgi:toxin CcdB